MFKRLTTVEKNVMMRDHWLQTKSPGKRRFILREMLEGLLIGAGVVVITDFLAEPAHLSSRGTTISVSVIMLLIFLLGGYLTAKWKWQDLEKKYSQTTLPPLG